MNLDVNECFDVQRNFIWGKEVWILSLTNNLAVKNLMSLSGSQGWGFSVQYFYSRAMGQHSSTN